MRPAKRSGDPAGGPHGAALEGDLVGVHVVSDDGLKREMSDLLARHRALLEELGGSYHAVAGTDVPATLIGFAAARRVTQLVLGTSRRSRWTELTRGSVVNRVIRASRDIDVHVISTDEETSTSDRNLRRVPIHFAHPRDRLVAAFVVAAAAMFVVTALAAHFSALQPHHAGAVTSSAGLLIFLGVVVVVAAIGGRLPRWSRC